MRRSLTISSFAMNVQINFQKTVTSFNFWYSFFCFYYLNNFFSSCVHSHFIIIFGGHWQCHLLSTLIFFVCFVSSVMQVENLCGVEIWRPSLTKFPTLQKLSHESFQRAFFWKFTKKIIKSFRKTFFVLKCLCFIIFFYRFLLILIK